MGRLAKRALNGQGSRTLAAEVRELAPAVQRYREEEGWAAPVAPVPVSRAKPPPLGLPPRPVRRAMARLEGRGLADLGDMPPEVRAMAPPKVQEAMRVVEEYVASLMSEGGAGAA